MADCELDKEEDLIAAAKQIAKALGSRKSLTREAIQVLSDLGNQLSSISMSFKMTSQDDDGFESLLDSVQDKLICWEADDHSVTWSDFLAVVDQARVLTQRLHESSELRGRAMDALHTAMELLEEEFRRVLFQNKVPYEPDTLSFRSTDEDLLLDEASVISSADDFSLEFPSPANPPPPPEDLVIDLITPEAVPELRDAAVSMFAANYDRECVEAYTGLRRDAMDECLAGLEIERMSIEDVIKTEWGSLNSKIKRWIQAMKTFVRVFLVSEKHLCDRIFSGLGSSVAESIFVECSKTSMLQLLNFGEAMSVGPQKPEKLFRVIDMYEVLAELVPEIEALYLAAEGEEKSGYSVAEECKEVLERLGFCVRATFLDFDSAVASNHSNNPISGGGIHPLTRYVMNYTRALTDYRETLDRLFDEEEAEEQDGDFQSPGSSPAKGKLGISPTARRFLSLVTSLERNLESKALLYRDVSLQHLFLMNNLHYIAQKVKGADLRPIFGDEWIRKCNGRFQQHAIDYQRASWGSILALLREDPSSNSVSKSVLRERFRSFYAAFEEVYRAQTGWTIPDVELREDVRISTSLNVIQAYRIFEGRHFNHISERHIKYSADDLETYLVDLFEGSVKSLQGHSRR